MGIKCLEQVDYDELDQVTLTIGVKYSMTDEFTVESEPASKRVKMKRNI